MTAKKIHYRVWKDGRRVFDGIVFSVSIDATSAVIFYDGGVVAAFAAGAWDQVEKVAVVNE